MALTIALLTTASSLRSQAVRVETWSGSMQSIDGTRPLRYLIPAQSNLQGFQIIPAGTAPESGGIAATDVQFTGISVRFRAAFGSGADCKLDAVPARGYQGACALASGDTMVLALIPPVPGMLLADHEVRLARDAAPPDIGRAASVFVLGPSGYSEVVRGTNDFTCFVERPTPNDIWPICHNREASDQLLPVERFRARLRASGLAEAAITDSVLQGYQRGRFRAPPSGAMGYMLSRYAWTADPSTGAQGFIGPHLHFYAPRTTNARIGVDSTQRPIVPMRVEREGRPDASIIVGIKVLVPTGAP